MHVAVYCPLVASLLLGAVAPALARTLPPATASRLLAASAVLAAAASCAALGVLALTLFGQVPAVAAVGHWSAGRLAATSPVPRPVAATAVVAVVLLGANGLRVLLARVRALLAARALDHSLAGSGQLVVVDDDLVLDAVAVPAGGGRVLASRSLLAALPAAERRALLVHESAHLVHRHHLYRLAADLAGAVDPLQGRVRGAVVFATERWADEAAAMAVGDRPVVARVLARSGLRSATAPRSPWAAVAMGRSGSPIVPRVRALLLPAPRQRPELLAGALALVAFALAAALHASTDSEAFFDPVSPHPLAAAHVPHARG